MNDLENEIAVLEEETNKLEAEKKAAQMGWQSGEYIYSNIKLAMQHLDQASAESQKNLLRALIEKVIVHEDKIAINMFIQNEALPDALPKPSEQDKNPTRINDQDEVYTNAQPEMAYAGQNSTGRQVWGGGAWPLRHHLSPRWAILFTHNNSVNANFTVKPDKFP